MLGIMRLFAMGKKKIRKKLKTKQQHQKILKMSYQQLLDKGVEALSNLKGKDSLNFLKAALTKAKQTSEIEVVKNYLLRGYVLRVQELENKQMVQEAQTILNHVTDSLPDPVYMDEKSMIALFYICDFNLSMKFYEEFIAAKKKSSLLERYLADKLIVANCWETDLITISRAEKLLKDVPIMKQAAKMMNQGKWKEAQEEMRTLPRSSPFAHIRMFCRAMTSFYADNDQDMKKAVSMIPEDSVFKKLTIPLMTQLSSYDGSAENEKLFSCVWEGSINIFKSLDKLLILLKQKKYNTKMKNAILAFSEELFPENKEVALRFILETILDPITEGADSSFFKMVSNINKPLSRMIRLKVNALYSPDAFLLPVAIYLNSIHEEFSEPESISIAKAMVISQISYSIFSNNYKIDVGEYITVTLDQLKISHKSDSDTALLEMVDFAISLDSQNMKLFELVARLPAVSVSCKKIKERLLLKMCEVFPLVPFPYLKLADFYHEKNAYRKSENILKKAMELAPYDSQVLDRYFISLIISAGKNLKRKNFNMLWKDFDKAKSLNLKSNEIVIKAKEIFYNIFYDTKFLKNNKNLLLDNVPYFSKLQILSLLLQDLNRVNSLITKTQLNQIIKLYKKELKAIGTLKSSEILALFLFIPFEWRYIYDKLSIVQLLCDNSKKILGYLNEEDLFTLIDQTLSLNYYNLFFKELKNRISAKDVKTPLLRFYYAAITSLKTNNWNYTNFKKIISDIDSETETVLRNAAIKFSKHTEGHIQRALESFNLQDFNSFFGMPFNAFDDDDDDYLGNYDDDDDDDDFFDDFFDDKFDDDEFDGEGLEKGLTEVINLFKELMDGNISGNQAMNPMLDDTVNMLESFIDDNGLRGASQKEIKNYKKVVGNSPEILMIADIAKALLKSNAKINVSREVKIFFA